MLDCAVGLDGIDAAHRDHVPTLGPRLYWMGDAPHVVRTGTHLFGERPEYSAHGSLRSPKTDDVVLVLRKADKIGILKDRLGKLFPNQSDRGDPTMRPPQRHTSEPSRADCYHTRPLFGDGVMVSPIDGAMPARLTISTSGQRFGPV